jgi:hypothetical protein
MNTPARVSHKGPHTGMLALLYAILFCVGLFPVTALYKQPYWPGPFEPASVIVSYFQNYGSRVLFCIVLQSGALICFGLFAVTIVSRLRFLGARAAGTYIALLGGVLVLANTFVGAMATWAMLHPAVAGHAPTLLALYYLSFGLGGPGFSVPMGLFIAGVSVTSGFLRLLPRWMVISGIVLAFAGELSLFNLAFPKLLFLIPLVRFPGFIWHIATGFLLPKTRADRAVPTI